MNGMQSFVTWFLNQLPSFLLSEPIVYIIGFVFAGLTIDLIRRIINLN